MSVLLLLIAGMCLCALTHCVAPSSESIRIRDGKEFGTVRGAFRHRWWNYYERAVSYADGRFYREAESDLREALRQRGEDQRMARTYGMHFIDYFPHRELGVVFYLQGNLKAAQQELEHSLDQYPSAKARFYLDRVRRRLIERRGGW